MKTGSDREREKKREKGQRKGRGKLHWCAITLKTIAVPSCAAAALVNDGCSWLFVAARQSLSLNIHTAKKKCACTCECIYVCV